MQDIEHGPAGEGEADGGGGDGEADGGGAVYLTYVT